MFSTTSRTRVAGALIGAAFAAAAIAPAAFAQQDLRSPDARDSAPAMEQPGAQTSITYDDVRSPDARDTVQSTSPGDDRRSPDARDVPAPPVESQPISVEPPPAGGFDWLSAAIGAAAGTGILILLLAFTGPGGVVGRRHRTVGA